MGKKNNLVSIGVVDERWPLVPDDKIKLKGPIKLKEGSSLSLSLEKLESRDTWLIYLVLSSVHTGLDSDAELKVELDSCLDVANIPDSYITSVSDAATNLDLLIAKILIRELKKVAITYNANNFGSPTLVIEVQIAGIYGTSARVRVKDEMAKLREIFYFQNVQVK